MAAGYMALSNDSWTDRIQQRRPGRCAFWRRDPTVFSVIQPGSPFFLLERQKHGRPVNERKVIGKAPFRVFRSLRLDQLAKTYALEELGVSSSYEVMQRWIEIGGHRSSDALVSVIELGAFEGFTKPITWEELDGIGVRVSPNMRQGMGLDSSQVESLIRAGSSS